MNRDSFPEWLPEQPSDGIPCRDCEYRLEDGSPWGYKKANCDKYKGSPGKPMGILFMCEQCKFYKKMKGGQ